MKTKINPTRKIELTHTKTPWKLEKSEYDYSTIITKEGQIIARCGSSDFLQAERNAAYIVRAVNSYEVILEAAQRLVDSIKWSGDINEVNLAPKISILSAAITKAEEGQ